MMEFLSNCLSFPVNVFSGLLIIVTLYWLVAAFGLLDIDSLDLDSDMGDVGEAGDMGDAADPGQDGVGAGEVMHDGGGSVLAAMMFKLGLYGVPMTLILTFVILFGWLTAYYGFHLVLGRLFDPGPVRYGLGAGLFLGALSVGIIMTTTIIRPLRRVFKKQVQVTSDSLRGRVVVVRSTTVTATYGEAIYEDGGAGMLLDVRPAREGAVFKRGERAVVLDYDAAKRLYTIISEDDFRGR